MATATRTDPLATVPAVPPLPENEAAIDSGLLARAGSGDRDAFRELYGRYSAPLFSLAIRIVGNAGEAEELLQDTFVKMWRHASSHDPSKSKAFTWAVTILKRTCIDHLRKRRRRPVTTPFVSEAIEDDSSREDGPRSAEAREDAERLRHALAGIPPEQRSALELALFSEMTQFEIAQRLGQPVGTVKSWIRRGMLGLRATLNDPAP
jgi:RNA polymerase sigma-70 factor (ECF subfamily)